MSMQTTVQCPVCKNWKSLGVSCAACGFYEGEAPAFKIEPEGKIVGTEEKVRAGDSTMWGGAAAGPDSVSISDVIIRKAAEEVNRAVAAGTTKRVAKSAAEIVQQAANEIAGRASLRDQADGERSMKRCVDAFNGLLGEKRLSEQEGWLFMCVLKMARATAGKHHLDDYTDLAGYAGLAGECGELKAANDDEVYHLNWNTTKVADGGI